MAGDDMKRPDGGREKRKDYTPYHLIRAAKKGKPMILINVMTRALRMALNCRKYRAANHEKIQECERKSRAAHPERYRESSLKWAKANPEKVREYKRKRRARKLGSAEHFDAAQWKIIKAFYGNQCAKCHRSETELTALGLHLVPDHVRALADGGSNDIGNIQPLCHCRKKGSTGGCNNRKRAKYEDHRPRFE